jgi:DNA invertase Pin-like site-specific DNA recombinase
MINKENVLKKSKNAISYVRVSTQGQGNDGNGMELQLIRIKAYAEEEGYEIINEFSDVQTGTEAVPALNRPGLREALKMSKALGCPIIVNGLDRISRSAEQLEKFIFSSGIKIISAQSGEGASKAVLIAEAKRAEAERERISSTTKAALGRLKATGVQLGNRTNLPEAQRKGAATNKTAALDQAKDLMEAIAEIRASGHVTKVDIARELNGWGFRTSKNQEWNKDNIRRLLIRIDEIEKERALAILYKDNPEHGSW